MSIEENKQIVLAMLEHWWDPDYLAAATSDDFETVVEADPEAVPFAGVKDKAHMLEVRRHGSEVLSDHRVTIKGVTAEGDRVAVETTSEMILTRADGTKKPITQRGHLLFELRDGKVSRIKEYVDTANILANAREFVTDG